MNSPNPLPLLGAVLAMILASAALVREPISPQESPPESPLADPAPQPIGLALLAPQSGAAEHAAERLAERRATSFIGRGIYSRDGDKVGEIKDLVLDEAGTVTHAILSHGGIGGLGTRQVAIPWQALKDRIRGNRIVLDRSRLEGAPALPEDDPHLTRRSWSGETDRYWERFRLVLNEDANAGSAMVPPD
jgi:sporulation protein YlmC with PRC-barrel domain